MLLPDKAFLEARYLELVPKGIGLTFQPLSCNKVKVPRHDVCLWGIIQLLCRNIKCSNCLVGLGFFLVLTTEKSEIVGASFKPFAEGILHLTQILRKQL